MMAMAASAAHTSTSAGIFCRYSQTTSIRRSRRSTTTAYFSVSQWNGLKTLSSFKYSISYTKSNNSFVFVTKKKKKSGVHASLFGVGAPEALVIGVVALLVFGPKGLAEVARNLGKTLRAFQPTIKELQDVSRDFKSTLEREIGIDDITTPTSQYTYKPPPSAIQETQQPTLDPNVVPKSEGYTSEDLLKITQEQLAASTVASQQTPSSQEQTQDTIANIPSELAAPTKQDVVVPATSSEKTDDEK